MRGRAYIDGNKMDFSVTVLSGFGGGHVDDFARSSLDNDVSVLPGEMKSDQPFSIMIGMEMTDLIAEHCMG